MVIVLRGFLLLAQFGDRIYSRHGMCEDSAFAPTGRGAVYIFVFNLTRLSYTGLYPRIAT